MRKLLIDADACPVIDIAVNEIKKYDIEIVLICDYSHVIDIEGTKTITVMKGADSADFKLINMTNENDIVITQDYGLASMCLAKKAIVLNQNGLIYDSSNIDQMLYSRHINGKLRRAGIRTKGPKKRDKQQDTTFLNSLKTILEQK